MKTLTIEDLFNTKAQSLALELLNDCSLQRLIKDPTISSPGLVLAGFTDRFPVGRLQILGETEIRFLGSLDDAAQRQSLDTFFSLDMPGVVVTKGLEVPTLLKDLANKHGIPLLRSQLKTGDFYRRLQPYLEEAFAPTTTMHGSLADVYGVGLLFVGRSGIGKSECVLDLVERGHRLVADDLVFVSKRGNGVLIGRGHEMQHHHMEIRGIGILDIKKLFGIRAIRQQKRIEVVVQLEDWNDRGKYDRTGLDTQQIEVLGIELTKVLVPLNAGKNITVLSEVIAMNHLLKWSGVDSAKLFNERLQQAMQPSTLRDYLEEDYE
ncbi:MAG TPA: HPr(Ser) kinase/phosphatase [Longimicrobiales bacterium]|nr:HPr(Ser) kinase/phosphatase [Longimicrobiales bacterium]